MATGPWGEGGDSAVFRATISFDRGGQKCQTGFHLRDLGVDGMSPEDVANEVLPWATTQFNKLIQSTERVTGIDVENLVTREGFSISPNNVVGVLSSALAPSMTSVAVNLKGNLRRRWGSGRMLWPVASMALMEGNTLSNTGITTFNAVIDDLRTRFIDGGVGQELRLVHLHGQIPATPSHPIIEPTYYDVTSIRLNTTLSSLRRRRPGSGS